MKKKDTNLPSYDLAPNTESLQTHLQEIYGIGYSSVTISYWNPVGYHGTAAKYLAVWFLANYLNLSSTQSLHL